MKYELLSVTPVLQKDDFDFILRVKKIPNIVNRNLGHKEEIVFIENKIVLVDSDDGIDFYDYEWFYFPLKNVPEQKLVDFRFKHWLINTFNSWCVMNFDPPVWKKFEEEYLDYLRELKKLKIQLDEFLEIKKDGFDENNELIDSYQSLEMSYEELQELIEDKKYDLEFVQDDIDQLMKKVKFNDNEEFHDNGTYKYMNILELKDRYRSIFL